MTKTDLIMQYVTEKILTGEYEKGTEIPSISELSVLLKVSKAPVITALRELKNEGMLMARPGKNYIVNNIFYEEVNTIKTREQAEKVLADYVWDNYGDIANTYELCIKKAIIPERNKEILNEMFEIMTKIWEKTP